jgi:Complex 1 protein (LYR family)
MAEALQVYRTLLRAINKNITGATGNKQWYAFATEEFRRHRTAADEKERAELLQLARDYAFMINGVRDHTVSIGLG